MLILYVAEEKKDIKVVEVEKTVLKDITQTVFLIGTIQAKRSTILNSLIMANQRFDELYRHPL
jgi:hypothetical protein